MQLPFCLYKVHLGATHTLREPDMTHGGKLELTHYDFLPFPKIQRAGNAVDARRGAGHDGDLIRAGVDELKQRRFVPPHSGLPMSPTASPCSCQLAM